MSVKNIEPRLRLIGEYVHNKNDRFVIPSYQRGYSWTTANCDKLWQDIENFRASGSEDPYFFGTIIIDCSTSNCLNLIDGQQRTTTFLLLMKALQLRLDEAINRIQREEDTKALIRGLEKSRDKIYGILFKADEDTIDGILDNWSRAKGVSILETQSINEIFKNDFVSIIEAKNFDDAESKVQKIPRRQKDNKYSNFFKNFKFFYEKLGEYSESQLNAFARAFLSECQIIEIKSWQLEQAINMFNSLNSTGMPLSDSDIISAQLYSHAENREEFGNKWKDLNETSDRLSQRKIVDLDGILQQYMYINRASEALYNTGNVQVPGVRKFYTDLQKKLLEDPMSLTEDFEKILNIWDKIKDYPEIKVMMKFNENFKLFLMPYLFKFDIKDISNDVVRPMAEGLLRLFALVEVGVIPFSSAKFKTFLFNTNLEIVKPETTIEDILATFDSHINSNWSEEKVIEEIKAYQKNIMIFLNEYLYAKEKGLEFDFADSVNIEHIMPASVTYH